ncbi:MAG: tetratricopeptide repeat protein [Acidobacteria bacterium]|nr:tetratricopeptide repeat protein [Acidobacteriota bacterium]
MPRILGLVLLFGSFLYPVFSQTAKDVEKRIEAIIGFLKDSKFDRAVSEAADLVAAHPYDFDVRMAAFHGHLQASQHDTNDPKSLEYLRKALNHLNFARRIEPENYEAWQSSLAFWDPSRLNATPQDPEAEKIFKEAADQFSSGELDKVTEALEKVINREPSYAPAYLHLGEVHLARNQFEEAVKFLRIATEKDPRDAGALLLLASVYGRMGKGEEAITNLVKSLKADPGFPLAWQQLTRLDLDGKKAEHMTFKFPKSVLWIIEREIKEPTDQNLEGVSAVTQPAWKTYIQTKIRWRQSEFAKRNPTLKTYRYSSGEEIASIGEMLAVWKETKASDANASDALLDHWLAASQAAVLDAAIYTDLFLEEFRPDFTLWNLRNEGKFEEYFYKFVLPNTVTPQK